MKDLTARQVQVVELASLGLEGPEIAEEMSISYNTVKCHKLAILERLEAKTMTEAAVKYALMKERGTYTIKTTPGAVVLTYTHGDERRQFVAREVSA